MTSSRYIFIGFVIIILLVISEIIADFIFAQKVQNNIAIIVKTHSTKIHLIHKMLGLTHSRISTLNTMLLEQDAFEVEDLYLKFLSDASKYIQTRRKLQKLLTSEIEKQQLNELRQIAIEGTPIVEEAVELARSEKNHEAIQIIMNQILPIQTKMYKKTQEIINFYQSKVAKQAETTQGLSLKWLDGVTFFGAGIVFLILFIALYVSIRTHRDRKSLVNEISERKTIENQLYHSQENLEKTVKERTIQLNQAQHIARLGHWEWEISSGKLLWSEEIFRIFGVSSQTFTPTYEAFVNTVHPEDREMVLLAIHDALSSEENYEISHRIILPDGRERYVKEKGVISRNTDNSPINMLGTVQDITESKALHDRLVLISSVFHNIGEGVMITDVNNHIVEINTAFSQLFGYTLDDIFQKNPNVLRSNHHEAEFYKKIWDSLINHNQWQGEIWNRCKNGELIPLLMTINVVKDENTHLINYVAIFRDISTIKKTEKHLWHIAHHDPLTQIPNRSLMYAHLHQAIKDAHRDKKQGLIVQ